jgi:hypothetical protein
MSWRFQELMRSWERIAAFLNTVSVFLEKNQPGLKISDFIGILGNIFAPKFRS